MIIERIPITNINMGYISQLDNKELNDLYDVAKKEVILANKNSKKASGIIDRIRNLEWEYFWNLRPYYVLILALIMFCSCVIYALCFIIFPVEGLHPILLVPICALSFVIEEGLLMSCIVYFWYRVIKGHFDCFGSPVVYLIGDFVVFWIFGHLTLINFTSVISIAASQDELPWYGRLLTFVIGLGLTWLVYWVWKKYSNSCVRKIDNV